MEITASPQYSQQVTAPNISRPRTAAQAIPRQSHGPDIAQYLGTQGDMRSASFAPSAANQHWDGFDASNFTKGNDVGSVLKQAVSFSAQVRENPFEKMRQATPFKEFSASFPQGEQEGAKRYAAAQGGGKTFAEIEDGIKRSIAGDTFALDEIFPSDPRGIKPADIQTTTTRGTVVTLLTPAVRYSETTAENFSLQVTRKDGFQLTLPLDGDVRINEGEDGSISLYYPASGKRLSYDAEGNALEEMLAVGEQGTDGDDILINVSGSRVESGSGNDTIFNLADDVSITGEGGNKTIFMGGATRKNVSVELGDGDNSIYGNVLQNSTVKLGNGNNIMAMNVLQDTGFQSGHGNTTIAVYINRGISMVLGDGKNTISLSDISSKSMLDVGEGNNSIKIGIFHDSSLNTGNGNNTINAESVSNGSINMGNGHNTSKVNMFNNSSLNTGKGNNAVNTNSVYNGSLNMGNGNNIFTVDTLINSYVSAGGGKNTITCDRVMTSQLYIGNDSHSANKDFLVDRGHGAAQDAGSTINIKHLSGSKLYTGSGNDSVIVDNKGRSTISTGAGDDMLQLARNNLDITHGVDTGFGNDTVFIKDSATGQVMDKTHLFK